MNSRFRPSRILYAIIRRIKELYHGASWYFTRMGKESRKDIQTFSGLHLNSTLYLIANGPSLAKMDIELLKGRDVMVMNRFYIMFKKLSFIPKYLVCVEETVLDRFQEDMSTLPCTTFVNWRVRDRFRNSHFLKESYALNPFFQYDLTKPTQFGGTVTFACLQLAYYMGYKDVIIIGMDHRFKETGTPATPEIRTYEKDESHFDPNYFPKGMKWMLPDLEKSEFSYRLARVAYEKDGRRIIDCTIDGNCNVFEKGRLEDYL
jgi:hypothetical protein